MLLSQGYSAFLIRRSYFITWPKISSCTWIASSLPSFFIYTHRVIKIKLWPSVCLSIYVLYVKIDTFFLHRFVERNILLQFPHGFGFPIKWLVFTIPNRLNIVFYVRSQTPAADMADMLMLPMIHTDINPRTKVQRLMKLWYYFWTRSRVNDSLCRAHYVLVIIQNTPARSRYRKNFTTFDFLCYARRNRDGRNV